MPAALARQLVSLAEEACGPTNLLQVIPQPSVCPLPQLGTQETLRAFRCE
jgi:hypothetical protein